MALCFPRRSTAAFSATRPTTWLSASMMYHLRSTCSALALKVFIGSRKLSHASRDVSKIFAVIFEAPAEGGKGLNRLWSGGGGHLLKRLSFQPSCFESQAAVPFHP